MKKHGWRILQHLLRPALIAACSRPWPRAARDRRGRLRTVRPHGGESVRPVKRGGAGARSGPAPENQWPLPPGCGQRARAPGIVAQAAGVPHEVVNREWRAAVGELGDVLTDCVVEAQFVLFRQEMLAVANCLDVEPLSNSVAVVMGTRRSRSGQP